MAGIPFDPGWTAFRRRAATLPPRARLTAAVRSFFAEREFLEVDTPLLVETPALELHIDAIEAGGGFLRTSPELHMKRLLAAGFPRLYQLGPCFRRGEQGALHHPEFTMLEWYRAEAGYADILADTKALLVHLGRVLANSSVLTYQGREIDLLRWERIPVREAFLLHAGWDPVAAWDEDRFDVDLVERVEPALPGDAPVVLTDYPAAAAALSRLRPDDPSVAERWELYIGGLEIANAYSELTDADEQAARFAACAERRRAMGKPVYPVDEAFLDALRRGLPPSGGIALGLDRLLMLFTDASGLDEVLPFR
jgi:elongation factor P--(R)-beta-lysine ligase